MKQDAVVLHVIQLQNICYRLLTTIKSNHCKYPDLRYNNSVLLLRNLKTIYDDKVM